VAAFGGGDELCFELIDGAFEGADLHGDVLRKKTVIIYSYSELFMPKLLNIMYMIFTFQVIEKGLVEKK
ncbi:MAG: hypothetical protein O2780_15120, partial [Proteobacteria bacterium]|nr:hypothetical protein [Pseudomonadota bacterium]